MKAPRFGKAEETRAPVTAEEAGRRVRAASRILLLHHGSRPEELLAATPVLRNLRRALPAARIVLLARPEAAAAVRHNPDLDEVAVLPRGGPARMLRAAALTRALRKESFEAALVLTPAPPSPGEVSSARGLAPGLLVGLGPGDGSAPDYDCVLEPPEDARPHVVDHHLLLLERLGIAVDDRRHRLEVTAAEAERAEALLAEAGADLARPLLAVEPGGSAHRRAPSWPASHYAAVLQRASAELGMQPVLLRYARNREATAEIASLGKIPVPTLSSLPFRTHAAVLARCAYCVTDDGGPVHLAAAVGAPSFFIFLSSPPWRWAPYGPHVSVWEDPERPPSPSEVWARIAPLLAAAPGAAEDSPREAG